MKFVTMACPKCGARLEVLEGTQAVCTGRGKHDPATMTKTEAKGERK